MRPVGELTLLYVLARLLRSVYPPLTLTSAGLLLTTDQEWKHSCYEHCLAPVLDVVSGPNPEYSTVLDLDKRIRDFSIPVPLQNGGTQSRSLIMQRASLAMALEAGAFLII